MMLYSGNEDIIHHQYCQINICSILVSICRDLEQIYNSNQSDENILFQYAMVSRKIDILVLFV